jgi:deazaflavin-dependent oxidoreductase (nitroreductase family)
MNHKPNSFQRALHSIISQRHVTRVLSNITEPFDKFVLALTKEKHTFTELIGWPMIELESTGAHSGQSRIHPLIGMNVDKGIILIGSNFGRPHHPAWVHNLRAHPQCLVHAHGKTAAYIARETDGAEREEYWQVALSYYKGYGLYEQRAAPRKISVWILEPK